jgi:hypothetical protein
MIYDESTGVRKTGFRGLAALSDRYILERELGTGGMATVVLKVMRSELLLTAR